MKYIKTCISTQYVNMLYNAIVKQQFDLCDIVCGIAVKACLKRYSERKNRLPESYVMSLIILSPFSTPTLESISSNRNLHRYIFNFQSLVVNYYMTKLHLTSLKYRFILVKLPAKYLIQFKWSPLHSKSQYFNLPQ